MGSDEWCTPPDYAACLRTFYQHRKGRVGLDPCSNDRSVIWADRRYTCAGHVLPWDADSIFENNPYSAMDAWTDKGMIELAQPHLGKLKELVTLVPCSPSTGWWERAVAGVVVDRQRYQPLIVFTKRLAFIGDDGTLKDGARFDSVSMVYASDARKRAFVDVFAPLIRGVVEGRHWKTPSRKKKP